jgi:hypothetical protein
MLGRKQSGMQQFLQVLRVEVTIAKDLVQQPRSDRFARVNWHHSSPPVFVTEKMVTSLGSYDNEAGLSKRG